MLDLMITPEQITELKNPEMRRSFLRCWQEWPELIRVPEIGMVLRHVVLPGGKRFTATSYDGGRRDGPVLNIQEPGKGYWPSHIGENKLIAHLTALKKEFRYMFQEDLEPLLQQQRDAAAAMGSDRRVIVSNETPALTYEEVRKIRNNPSREQYIRQAHETWPLWIEVPLIGMKLYRMGLPDGYNFFVTIFEGRARWCRIGKAMAYAPFNGGGDMVTKLRDLRGDYLAVLREAKKQRNAA